jgi:hypothetical protein
VTGAAKKILEAARKLSRKERAFVIAELARPDDPRMSDDDWYEEIERRIADFDMEDEDAEAVGLELLAEIER